MNKFKVVKILNLITILLFVLDRYLKNLAFSIGDKINPIIDLSVLKINFVFSQNPNMAFGLPMNSNIIIIANFILLFLIAIYAFRYYKYERYFNVFAIILILFGALSNIYDRLTFKAVTDYIDIQIFTYIWPTFNVADAMIVVGIILWLYFDYKKSIINYYIYSD